MPFNRKFIRPLLWLAIGAVLIVIPMLAARGLIPGREMLFEVQSGTGKLLKPTVLGAILELAGLGFIGIGIFLGIRAAKTEHRQGPWPTSGCGCGCPNDGKPRR